MTSRCHICRIMRDCVFGFHIDNLWYFPIHSNMVRYQILFNPTLDSIFYFPLFWYGYIQEIFI